MSFTTEHFLQESLLFSTSILGSVFSDYVVFYGDSNIWQLFFISIYILVGVTDNVTMVLVRRYSLLQRTFIVVFLIRSTPLSLPNKVGLKCPSARPYVHKKFLRFQRHVDE